MNLERDKLWSSPHNPLADVPLVLSDMTDAPLPFLDSFPEDGEFYRATQQAIPGFSLGYLVAHRAGVRVAVVPYFVTEFSLNTMLEPGLLKRVFSWGKLRIACVGHPTAAFGRIDGEVSAGLLQQVWEALKTKAPIVAFKGFGPELPVSGFVRVVGLPVAVLRAEGDFWNRRHNHKQRYHYTRRLKIAAALRFEEHDGLPAVYLEQVHQLYLNTRNRSPLQFECLSPEYFSATSPHSLYLLVFLQERLVGFAQMLVKGKKMVAKYAGMDYSVNREHGLYFALYLHALDICRHRGFGEIEFGETEYQFKQQIGCELVDTWLYYRHRKPLLHALLARLAFLVEPSANELPR